MSDKVVVTTERLRLRRWLPADAEPFAALNADPRVMEFLGPPLSRAESDAFIARVETRYREHGIAWWAVEIPGVTPFAGFLGLSVPSLVAHFTPCVEVGWRLAPEHWGHGYATEGARAALRYGFETLGLREIVAQTSVPNVRSRRVMEKIGMTRDPGDDFEHPQVPEGSALRPHVLYRIRR
jgi:RimJ/RimL family protein N-acetyltransferase